MTQPAAGAPVAIPTVSADPCRPSPRRGRPAAPACRRCPRWTPATARRAGRPVSARPATTTSRHRPSERHGEGGQPADQQQRRRRVPQRSEDEAADQRVCAPDPDHQARPRRRVAPAQDRHHRQFGGGQHERDRRGDGNHSTMPVSHCRRGTVTAASSRSSAEIVGRLSMISEAPARPCRRRRRSWRRRCRGR